MDSPLGDRVDPTFPAGGEPESHTYRIEFTWQGEPTSREACSTARRDVILSELASAGISNPTVTETN